MSTLVSILRNQFFRCRVVDGKTTATPTRLLPQLLRMTLMALLLLSIGCQLAPQSIGVVEERQMSRVLSEANAGTLVVFDIDNTLLEPVSQLGSDQWYYYLTEVGVRRGMTRDQASTWADKIFNDTQPQLTMRCVDAKSPHVLAELRRRGIPYFALTARSAGIHEITHRQLAAVGLDLTKGCFAPGNAAAPNVSGKGSIYDRGVFFIGETGPTKGEALVRILKAAKCKPNRIVFVDDKEKHVRTVDEELTNAGIQHLCLRFAKADAKVAALPQEIKDAELLIKGR